LNQRGSDPARAARDARRARRRRTKRAGAITASALLHGAGLFFLINSASGDLVSGGAPGPEGKVFAVEMVLPNGAPIPRDAEEGGEVSSLLVKVRPAPPDQALLVNVNRRADPMASLMRRLRHPGEAEPEPRAIPSPAPPDPTREPAEARQRPGGGGSAPQSQTTGPTASAPGTGDLWGRIEPCWRKQSRYATVPVTLEISLDAQGRLTAPPKILRGERAKLDEQQLASEERALSSLNACMPQRDLRFAQATYRLDFRPE
jgi:hypothetical protein